MAHCRPQPVFFRNHSTSFVVADSSTCYAIWPSRLLQNDDEFGRAWRNVLVLLVTLTAISKPLFILPMLRLSRAILARVLLIWIISVRMDFSSIGWRDVKGEQSYAYSSWIYNWKICATQRLARGFPWATVSIAAGNGGVVKYRNCVCAGYIHMDNTNQNAD